MLIFTELIRARDEYSQLDQSMKGVPFYLWIKETYGIELELIKGIATSHGKIVDEKKYLIFKLKFGVQN